MRKTITLASLLETHDKPFAIIDASMQIVAVNSAYARHFSVDADKMYAKPCCASTDHSVKSPARRCRHQQLFQDLEPYADTHAALGEDGEIVSFRVRGYPLVDADMVIYLGEAISPLGVSGSSKNPDSSPMVGKSAAFLNLADQLNRAAATDAALLLHGETGTGKELAAEYTHRHSRRGDKEFVVVDCTVLGEGLFESELFGHEKGSFTGAAGVKKGLFQLADGGTLFLDEIGELPLSSQPKLLRALESGTFRRVGGTETLKSDVRVISATHRNLDDLIQAGEFREDLYFRMSVFPVSLPSLRERIDDIPTIAQSLLSAIGASSGTNFQLSPRALEHLCNHPFPGNVRELRNTLQLASALSTRGLIDVNDIHLRARETPGGSASSESTPAEMAIAESAAGGDSNPIERVEAAYINYLIDKHKGNRKKVAFEMDISERTLYRKLKRLDIKQSDPSAACS